MGVEVLMCPHTSLEGQVKSRRCSRVHTKPVLTAIGWLIHK